MYKLERAMQRININKDISAVNINNIIDRFDVASGNSLTLS